MKLTVHTDYALRLLMVLAIEPDGLHTIEEIAARHGISRNHLMKVAQTLVRGGFVTSQRGRAGGLMLSRAPAEIIVGDVVRATEDDCALVECFDPARNQCRIVPGCGLIAPLQEALAAFFAVLDGWTLADLVGSRTRQHQIRRLLPGTVRGAWPRRLPRGAVAQPASPAGGSDG